MPSNKSLLSFLLAAAPLTTFTLASPAGQLAARQTPAPNPAAVSAALAASAAAVLGAESASEYAAQSQYDGGSPVNGADNAAPTGPDECGPAANPDPTVPDSCTSFVQRSNGPATYGVQCLNDGTHPAWNITSCSNLIAVLCSDQWQHLGEWVWATTDGCSLGSYLPKIQGAAKAPEQQNCEAMIYGSMLDTCADKYNIAAVNLKTLPDNTGTGSQVNEYYGSYIIAADQPRKVGLDGAAPVQMPAQQIIASLYAAQESAIASESAILATMTGTVAAAARSDLAQFASDIKNGGA